MVCMKYRKRSKRSSLDPSHNSSSTPVTVTLGSNAGVGANLQVASLATLDIVSDGSLTISNAVDNFGLIDVIGTPSSFVNCPPTYRSNG